MFAGTRQFAWPCCLLWVSTGREREDWTQETGSTPDTPTNDAVLKHDEYMHA